MTERFEDWVLFDDEDEKKLHGLGADVGAKFGESLAEEFLLRMTPIALESFNTVFMKDGIAEVCNSDMQGNKLPLSIVVVPFGGDWWFNETELVRRWPLIDLFREVYLTEKERKKYIEELMDIVEMVKARADIDEDEPDEP
jgi:hypothetical protein